MPHSTGEAGAAGGFLLNAPDSTGRQQGMRRDASGGCGQQAHDPAVKANSADKTAGVLLHKQVFTYLCNLMRGIIFAILFVLLVIFVVLATERRERHRKTGAQNLPPDTPADAACKSCQLVEQCDKKAEPQSCSEPTYFDDEELDSFRGRASDSYTEQEVALFREII